jgi:hypothetical protein
MEGMTAIATPPGGGPITLDLNEEPKWSRGEQGGYKDATLKATIDNALRKELRLAEVVIHGPSKPVWFGHVKDVDGDTLTCTGWQQRLDDLLRGCLYRTNDASRFVTWERTSPNVSIEVDDAGKLSATFTKDQAYKSGEAGVWLLHLPEPTSTFKISLTVAGLPSSNYGVKVYYAQNYTTGTWTLARDVSDGSDGTYVDTVTDTNITTVRVQIQARANVTPPSDVVITAAPTIWGTSVVSATVANVVGHILTSCGTLVPMQDVEAIATVLEDLEYDCKTSELAKFAEILKYGDWRFYFDARLDAGVWKPCAIFGSRPTVPLYTLTEDGSSVICDFVGESAEPLCKTVKVVYHDRHSRPRIASVTDTDESHYLVAAGLSKERAIEVSTTSATLATAAGTRYLIDAGRDQVQGTVTLIGSPGGIPACEYVPGELLTLSTRTRGIVTARITEAAYDGPYMAQLTLDNTPDLGALIGRLNMANSRKAMMRA